MKPITRYLPRELGQLAYDDSGGDGPVCLAIAGMGDLRDQFRALRPLLLAAGWRVITVDARGQGESSIFWQDYSAQACARDVLALLDALGIVRAVLIGHSFAAGVACLATALAPQRVQAQVWLGPVLRAQHQPWWTPLAMKIGFAGPWRAAMWLRYRDSLFVRRPADHLAQRNRLAARLREPGRMRALRALMAYDPAQISPHIAAQSTPTLALIGAQDADLTDPAGEAAWLASHRQVQVQLLADVGHYPQLEAPPQTADAMLAFLR